jgi:DNA-binding NarL/FixJ family response regulator
MESATPNEALAAWTAVLQGRWRVIQFFDADGHHHVVALENGPRPDLASFAIPRLGRTTLRALSLLGRGSRQKAIAFELGLSPSRVSRLLDQARATLTSRAELIRVARAALGKPYAPIGQW